MTAKDALKEISAYLPVKVREVLLRLPDTQIQEIRLRVHKPFGIVAFGKEFTPDKNCVISPEDMNRTFQAVCSYSVYRYEQELADGYITVKGGCRVGICGSAVREGQSVKNLNYISSLNFRIAGEYLGIAETVWHQVEGSILLAGTAGSGKTTYLRDFCRLCGNQYRTALIDERGELASVRRGIPSHDIGNMTDVFDGYPRTVGVLTALRVMNPEYMICDEISTPEDVQALLQVSGCGVKVIASCHAGSLEELKKRPVLKPLLENGFFQYHLFLKEGHIQTVRRIL
ncbi:MAG: stage III sporulation protein AA [Oscillospiraceae bacterium]|nr:stage III sporulation protein AA [Oscillospiraceae bacterium]